MNQQNRPFVTVLVAAALGLVLAGCGAGRIPFTHEVRTQYNLSDQEVRNLQFYVSHTVTLRRELDATSRQITGGHKLVLQTGKVVEEVVVEEDTPGIVEAIGPDSLTISFDVGSAMVFALRSGHASPSPPINPGGRFADPPPDPFPGESSPEPPPPLLDPTLTGKYWLATDASGGTVSFQGVLFDAVEDSYKAHLLIDADTLDEVVENRTVLPGRRLGQSPPWLRRGVAGLTGGKRGKSRQRVLARRVVSL